MKKKIDLERLEEILSDFAMERDWVKFHAPKNLAMAIATEAGELLEILQWMTLEESHDLKQDPMLKGRVSEELSDILLYVIRMAQVLDIDLSESIYSKIELNKKKYPVDKVKGSSKKYNEY